MKGWHWLAQDRRLLYGTRDVVEAGRTYTADGPLEMCRNGMHASKRAIDALHYAPGPIVCRVMLSGGMIHRADKSVARSRRVVWLADATTILHEFALMVATDCLSRQESLGETVDPRSWLVLDMKRKWLRGEATDSELADVRAAARAAVRDTAWAAASAAARAAVWDANNLALETMLESLAP